MISGEPKPLNKDANCLGFTPDSACCWVVIYAAPCPTCEDTNDPHDRLYIVPMIGWMEFENGGIEQRPAVMLADGTVIDYLDLPERYKFVAVLQDDENAIDVARILYKKRFGDAKLDDNEESVNYLPN